jgi:hypothetical protein
VVLCLSGALAGAIQPLVMRPQVEQPRRSPDLLFGRDDCPGCDMDAFDDCFNTSQVPACRLCKSSSAKMILDAWVCGQKYRNWYDAYYWQCTGTTWKGYVCEALDPIICWTERYCDTSKTLSGYKCDNGAPSQCSDQQPGSYCRHCLDAGETGLWQIRSTGHCVECEEGS